jgi:hypothetical protein
MWYAAIPRPTDMMIAGRYVGDTRSSERIRKSPVNTKDAMTRLSG